MEVTPLSEMPQGTMSPNRERSVFTLRAKPWLVTHREMRTPIAASLASRPASPTQIPVSPSLVPP